jgi:UDP-N-acetylmuramoyl-L-alanyl-D-glutamate--2,6-diaminopimelate ligase
VSLASPGDIVLIAGKGHEKYQEINGVRIAFDDRQILEEMFRMLEK